MTSDDRPISNPEAKLFLDIAFKSDSAEVASARAAVTQILGRTHEADMLFESAFSPFRDPSNSDIYWMRFIQTQDPRYAEWDIDDSYLTEIFQGLSLSRYAANLAQRGPSFSANGMTRERLIRALASIIRPPIPRMTPFLVPAFREIRKQRNEEEADVFGGVGLIESLHALFSPSVPSARKTGTAQFAGIQDLVRQILDDETAELSIPHTSDSIHIRRAQQDFDLRQMGSGIHELVIIASACTIASNSLICLEEPEIHLHPTLQRRLVAYLAEHTSNAYIISTHSPNFLDQREAVVFHIQNSGSGSKVDAAVTIDSVGDLCDDLGCRPSDIAQANCVLWVEGPSDKIYLCHWLTLTHPNYKEGVDYVVMFYGGRLLSHLSADHDIESFIGLQNLNRHLMVLMDSDIRPEGQEINATKRRIVSDLEGKSTGLSWVTQGYCIENYIPHEIVRAAVKAIHGKKLNWAGAKNIPPLGRGGNFDKVRIARWVTEHYGRELLSNPGSDLQERLEEVGQLIQTAARSAAPKLLATPAATGEEGG